MRNVKYYTKLGIGDYCCEGCGFQTPELEKIRAHVQDCEHIGYLTDQEVN